MTEMICLSVQDRMPEVSAGRGSWTAEEARHLAECADCATAWQLVVATQRLGAELDSRYDPTLAIARVSVRLRETKRPVWGRPRVLVGLAAAAALLFVTLPRLADAPGPETAVADEALFLSELDSLTTSELAIIADEMAPPLSEVANPEPAPLSDLDSTQLERVLRSLEG